MPRSIHVLPIILAALSVAWLALAGCSRPQSQEGGGQEASGFLIIKGSDTMVHLVSDWAEAYMTAHPKANVSVTGGGSGTGFAALLNGTTDLCMSSRNIKPEEQELARKQDLKLEETVVGRDGIVIAVHPENPIGSLTMEQLEKIFTGAYTRWSEVGGPDESIIVCSRESNSGTYVFFQEHVLNKKDFTPQARLLPANSAIVQAVTTDKNAIGYIGLGYAAQAGAAIKVLTVAKEASSPAIQPSLATVTSGEYPIARTLLFYAPQEKSAEEKSFIDFCLSAEGQTIVQETGYVPLS
ncbi:MAG: phosphate ABC transporter substrate-binding protein [Candidatus Hydrogenedentes bacterium]|nr:phosphate ABC transporter substrate-binding protein [Candidatus Hydrogenedentota bacterium]